MSSRRLTRSRTDRMIAGVCGGLAEHVGVDPARVRMGFVLTTVFGGAGAVLYLVLWAVLPEAPRAEAPRHEAVRDGTGQR